MADTKPLPPSASAEGETAALQGQIIEASTLDEKNVAKDAKNTGSVAPTAPKAPDAGLKNYLVSLVINAGFGVG